MRGATGMPVLLRVLWLVLIQISISFAGELEIRAVSFVVGAVRGIGIVRGGYGRCWAGTRLEQLQLGSVLLQGSGRSQMNETAEIAPTITWSKILRQIARAIAREPRPRHEATDRHHHRAATRQGELQ